MSEKGEVVRIQEQHQKTIEQSDHDVLETVDRALTLYRELDGADELLADCDLLDDD